MEISSHPPGASQVRASAYDGRRTRQGGRDYKKIGLLFPIVVFVDNSGEERGEKGPFEETLIAGRNRLEILRRAGVEDPRGAKIQVAISTALSTRCRQSESRVLFA